METTTKTVQDLGSYIQGKKDAYRELIRLIMSMKPQQEPEEIYKLVDAHHLVCSLQDYLKSIE